VDTSTRDPQSTHARWFERGVTVNEPQLTATAVLDRLAGISSARRVEAGTVLTRAGEGVSKVIVLREGGLELSVRTSEGRRIVALIHAGGVVADVAALCGTPMPFNVTAVRDSTIVEVEPAHLLTLLRSSPELSLYWMVSLARRLLASHRHALALLRKDTMAQVAAILLLEQEPAAEGPPLVRLSQEAIAELIGASRQSVSRVLSRLRERELVQTGYRTVVLLDQEALANVAGEHLPTWECRPLHTLTHLLPRAPGGL
jgi:CRP/FNR family cyclic AMP-dependent transcriptional regulator